MKQVFKFYDIYYVVIFPILLEIGGALNMVYRKKVRRVEDDWVDDQDIYSDDFRELLIEDDAISAEEEAFMRGYEEAR